MKFKATLIILAILATIAVCFLSCSSRKKNIDKYDSLSYAKSVSMEKSREMEASSLKSITFTKKTDSDTVKTTIKPKGSFTYSNGVFTGEAESVDILSSHKATSDEKKVDNLSTVKLKDSLKSQEKEKKTEVGKKSVQKISDNTGKLIAIGIIVLTVGLSLWYIRRQIKIINVLGS